MKRALKAPKTQGWKKGMPLNWKRGPKGLPSMDRVVSGGGETFPLAKDCKGLEGEGLWVPQDPNPEHPEPLGQNWAFWMKIGLKNMRRMLIGVQTGLL